ncbi:hypothetical protein BAY61_16660 [Prauserella marina]|uniref:Uncharacterized protein n=1 Tax=Prauserella marina TaxID=530584 RepID=A0A222VR22_9PSEU|nr:hypothetical protein [Prauserella marina]ASR36367.1 hypothetical protein BAY61_16660 [Prauserella marina]PWV77164.1 hypothetical protein DES30_105381 [Prauserella marina]SDD05887.1 hypothetical protein SAMN05421630_105382 [Prauserella marina]
MLTNVAAIDSLRAVGVPVLGEPAEPVVSPDVSERLLGELAYLLSRGNGMYAFDAALHVFPSLAVGGVAGDSDVVDVAGWNDPGLWIRDYDSQADGMLFFAEDFVGSQFAARGDEVVLFDPETAETEVLASSINDWARLVLLDNDYMTGHGLVREWLRDNEPLAEGNRLMPKVPFCAGGAFEVSNLYSGDAVTGMRSRAAMAVRLRDLPDDAPAEALLD